MTISEKFYFARQLRQSFDSIGAVIPTSRYAGRAMAAEVARRRGPKTILEVGPGTGSITAEIIKHLGPADRLVLCEINPDFVAYLRQRLERDPDFRRVRDRVILHAINVADIKGSQVFDCIVSAVPFTSLPVELTESILARYRDLLKPGGTLTYIEYAYLRALKHHLASAADRNRAEAVNAVLDRYIERHQFRRDRVWRNVPPAWIRHLRLSEPQPEDALVLQPLEQTHRITLGPLAMADDALPLVTGLGALAVLCAILDFRLRILDASNLSKIQNLPLNVVKGPKSKIQNLWLLPVLAAATLAWFFRDPTRQVMLDPDVAYAACDGRVLSVERVRDPRLGNAEWLRIAVFLSLANVHINRAPVAGKVVQIFHEAGGYAAADSRSAEHNTAQYTVIEGVRGRCVVAQRVGLVARRIVNWSRVGQLLAQGERYGLIRLGSRTDVYLPADQVQACVTPGDPVRAGTTVLARYVETSR